MKKNKSILSWLVISVCFLIFISSVIFFVQNKGNETTENLNVTLTDVGGTKVAVIKAVREITGLGLVDAKKLVDGVPAAIKENVSPEEAESIKEKLVAAGATVEIK